MERQKRQINSRDTAEVVWWIVFIRLFGRVTVGGPIVELDAGPPTQKKLLALLALSTGHFVPLERLYDEMWGMDPPENAEQMVRIYVSRLRKLFASIHNEADADPVIVTAQGGYRLDIEKSRVDVHRFEELVAAGERMGDPFPLREALGLWRDDPLADFPYDEFAVRLRDRLKIRRLAALETALKVEIDMGVQSSALSELAQLVEENPLRERLWALLIVALYRSGQQAEALRAYDRSRLALAEVGLEPGRELQELLTSITSQPHMPEHFESTGGLPVEVNSFIGRVNELARLDSLLSRSRLVTVVGPGGSGKTSLAVRFARGCGARVWFVDLSGVTDVRTIHESILEAFGGGPANDMVRLVTRLVGGRPCLLVIDNCEHLADAVALTIEQLLAGVAELRVLATSREPLRTRGEDLLRLDPLQLPGDDSETAVRESEAGRLFLERAWAAADFELDAESSRAVAAILRQLDGIPLAIELAAVHVGSAPIDTLAAALNEDLAEAGAIRRTLMPRHRTLRAALTWSYRLLEESERLLFRRLGILVGDFGAELVPGLGGSMIDMRGLVSKSMVVSLGDRYRLLVPIRSYGLFLLEQSGEIEEVRAMRNEHYLKLCDELTSGPRKHLQGEWQERFRLDRTHILAALDDLWATDPEKAVGTISAIVAYWHRLGMYSEGQRLAERALAAASTIEQEIDLKLYTAHFMEATGEFMEAGHLVEDAMSSAIENNDDARLANAHNLMGIILGLGGHLLRSIEELSLAGDLYATARPEEWFIPLINLSAALAWSGETARSSEIIARLRASGLSAPYDPTLDLLDGIGARMEGDLRRAESLFERSIEGLARHRSAFHGGVGLVEWALVRFERDDIDGAEILVEMAIAAEDNVETSLYTLIRARRIRAEVALRRDDIPTAMQILIDGLDIAARHGIDGGRAVLAETAALVASATGDAGLAAELLAWADRERGSLGIARDAFESSRAEKLRRKTGLRGTAAHDLGTDPLLRFVRLALTR